MPRDLTAVLNPAHTAVLTMEMQRGVAGDLSFLPPLADAVAADGTVTTIAAVCRDARAAGIRVVHCTMENRPDSAGFLPNAPILTMASRQRTATGGPVLESGGPGAALIPELEPHPRDIVVPRFSGLTPFTGTALDQTLRNLGVTTVVATGVSVNVAIIGLVLEAVGLGYQAVVVRDGVAGIPKDYAEAVLDTSIAASATVLTARQLRAVWAPGDRDRSSEPEPAARPPIRR